MNRRIIGVLAFLMLLSAALPAQRTDLSGIKICIDPGHGGYNAANDRHVIPDAGIDFWESESNFRKALALRILLQEKGATVYLTRETNDYPNPPDAEPSLSARWQFANANNVDWFHSIHSNAFNGTVNYALVLVKENIATRQAVWPQAVTMSGYVYQQIRAKLRVGASSGNSGTAGVYLDYTFYGGPNGGFNLGVLNGLAMPGQLSEGSFHDYYPETRRLMNNDYRKMEAYALRDAFLQYFGVPADSKGIIAGIQRDGTTSAPINGTAVVLQPNNVQYNGDAYNNGFYMFDGLTAGNYTLIFKTQNYRTDTVAVTVTAGGITFLDKPLTFRPDTTGPQLTSWYPENGRTDILPNEVINLTFNKYVNLSDLAANKGTVTVSENGFPVYHYSNSLPLGGRTGGALWPYFPNDPKQMRPGQTYRVDVQNVRDNYGNLQASAVQFEYTTANVQLDPLVIDSLESDASGWQAPLSNPNTTGVVADSVLYSLVTSPRVPVISPNLASRRLKYGWADSTVPGLLELRVDGGKPASKTWTNVPTALQVYLAGDAGGTLVRFVVLDSIDGFTMEREAGPWTRIDWSGWRTVTWNMMTHPPTTDLGGNGEWNGTRRLEALQFASDSLTSLRFGQVYFDQVQVVTMTSLSDVDELAFVPTAIHLEQNYPNPFNPSTNVDFRLSNGGSVKMSVVDVLGREVAVLVNEEKQPGRYQVTWNAEGMTSGVYYLWLQAAGETQSRKMVLMR